MNDIIVQPAMKAVIRHKGKLLILRESKTDQSTVEGRYHFPGGRLKPGENHLDGLRREIREETGLEITIKQPLFVGEWMPIINGLKHQIIAVYFLCEAISAEIKLSLEHDKAAWIEINDSKNYDIVETDLKVIEAYVDQALTS